jgi:hypothetical protein
MYNVNMLVKEVVEEVVVVDGSGLVLFSINTLKLASAVVGGTHEVIFIHNDIAKAPLSNFAPD